MLNSITQPYANCVYQRGSDGAALVPVAGTVAAGVDNVTCTFTPVNGGKLTVQTLPVDKDGNFGGAVSLPGGWYSFDVPGVGSIFRVGAGEVLIAFGHSFIQGGHDQSHQLPATDERSITLLDTLGTVENKFGKITGPVGPFHEYPDAWGQLADRLVKRLGVPVMIYGCGYGGSNIEQNYQVVTGANPRTAKPPGYDYQAQLGRTRQPLEPLESVFRNYVPHTGVRALLVEHGYNDRGTDTATFEQRFRAVFDYIRQHYAVPELPIVLVQEQLTAVPNTLYDIPTAQGLADLIKTYPDTYPGPDFNGSEWAGMFSQHNHLFGPAIDLYAQQWDQSLTAAFFTDNTPYTLTAVPDVFPAVLYNAPVSTFAPLDYLIVIAMMLVLVLLFIKQQRYLMWAFGILILLALGQVTGKV